MVGGYGGKDGEMQYSVDAEQLNQLKILFTDLAQSQIGPLVGRLDAADKTLGVVARDDQAAVKLHAQLRELQECIVNHHEELLALADALGAVSRLYSETERDLSEDVHAIFAHSETKANQLAHAHAEPSLFQGLQGEVQGVAEGLFAQMVEPL